MRCHLPTSKTPASRRAKSRTPTPSGNLNQPSLDTAQPLTPNLVLRLQRTIGNRAVQRLLQRRQNAAPVQRAGGQLALPRNNEMALAGQQLAEYLPQLAEALRPMVLRILAAIQDGRLTITPAQAHSLLGLLRNLQGALAGAQGVEIPEGDQGPIPQSLSLSQILSMVLQVDVSEILEGHDLLIPLQWLQQHPLDVTGLFGDGNMPPGGHQDGLPGGDQPPLALPGSMALMAPGQTNLANFLRSQPPLVRLYLVQHMSRLPLALFVLMQCGMNVSHAGILMPLCSRALQDGLAMSDLAPVINLARRSFQHAPQVFQALRLLRYHLQHTTALMTVLFNYPPLDNHDMLKALHLFTTKQYRLESVEGWLRSQGRARRRPEPAPRSPLSPNAPIPYRGQDTGARLPANPLEAMLGLKQMRDIRRAILQYDRAYSTVPTVSNQARRLLDANNNNVADTATLLLLFCNNNTITNATQFEQAARVAAVMFQNRARVNFDAMQLFFNNHMATAILNDVHLVIGNFVARRDIDWTTLPTWNDLVAVITLLTGAPHNQTMQQINTLLTNQFPETPGLTPGRLLQRLNYLFRAQNAGGRGLAVTGIPGEFQTLEGHLTPRLNQGTMSQDAGELVRRAFRLLNCTPQSINTYLGNNAVRSRLNNARNTNPAYWLYLFARYHRGRPATPPFVQNVVVPGHGQPVGITEWIVDHIRERHTFQNFLFEELIINRSQNSTFFDPEATDTDDQIIAILTRLLQTPEVQGGAWNGVDIQIGSYQMRIAPVGPAGAYRITQLYYVVAAGIQIPRQVLHALRNMNAFQ